MLELNQLYLMDCLEGMREIPDKYFELAIVDVPYGIGEGSDKILSRHHSQKKYHTGDWDKTPPPNGIF